jgi:2-keto-4-pentenoate hydratase/2-oxohepta-3-ene-1,7-dioic acid hydratase in catechol pathway
MKEWRNAMTPPPRERSQMAKWIRFEQNGKTGFGTLEDDTIVVHTGDMFAGAKPNGEKLKLSSIQVVTPCDPSKMVCLWNNFHQLAAKNDFKQPKEPLWFLKAPNSYHPANRPIERPATYAGKSSMRANSASSSARSASTSPRPKPATISSATPA